jgi:5-methylcytosine-specific restriction endonuclease McrA
MKQKWDACIDCGCVKIKAQRNGPRCGSCSQKDAYLNKGRKAIRPADYWGAEKIQTYSECIDCGASKKKTGAQRCKSCAAKVTQNRPGHREKWSASIRLTVNSQEYKSRFGEIQREAQLKPDVRMRKSKAHGGLGDLTAIDQRKKAYANHMKSELGQWSTAVKERDGRQCKHCGSSKYLHAHHIKQQAMFPELALDLDNGITLCRSCHTQEHRRIRATVNP